MPYNGVLVSAIQQPKSVIVMQMSPCLIAQWVKNLPAVQETWVSWVEKIPWKKKWQPTPGFLPGEPHGQRSLTVQTMGLQESGSISDWTSTTSILSLPLLPSSNPCRSPQSAKLGSLCFVATSHSYLFYTS